MTARSSACWARFFQISGDFQTRLTPPLEDATGSHKGAFFRLDLSQRQSAFQEAGGEGLSVQPVQLRFGIEGVDLAGTPLEEDEDDILGLARKMRIAGCQGVHRVHQTFGLNPGFLTQ